MERLKMYFVSTLLTALLSCGDDEEELTFEVNKNRIIEFSASIDGVEFEADFVSRTTEVQWTRGGAFNLKVLSVDGELIEIDLLEDGVGEHNSTTEHNRSPYNCLFYTDNEDNRYSSCTSIFEDPTQGKVEIEINNETTLKGSFEFTGVRDTNIARDGVVEITRGSFEIITN